MQSPVPKGAAGTTGPRAVSSIYAICFLRDEEIKRFVRQAPRVYP